MQTRQEHVDAQEGKRRHRQPHQRPPCPLDTPDAADETLCVDSVGRRMLQKEDTTETLGKVDELVAIVTKDIEARQV